VSASGRAFALLASFTVAAGCAAEKPPLLEGTPREREAENGPSFTPGNETNRYPPECGKKPDGEPCECLEVPLFVDPPTIYFVLDRSGSMRVDQKWSHVRTTVATIMRKLGPRAKFGAAVFPRPDSKLDCATGIEVMSVRAGDPPSSFAYGPTTVTLLNATLGEPSGSTPTAASLEDARKRLESVPGRKYVILATDGAPNCNPRIACALESCQINLERAYGCVPEGPLNCCEPPFGDPNACTDAADTVTAIKNLVGAGVPVYVVGLPGALPYAALLDQMAMAGNTALAQSPRYFAVGAASEAVMLSALQSIAAKITATCSFELAAEPAAADLVNVYLDDRVLPYDPTNSWSISGKTVTLLGEPCSRVMAGEVLDVRIIAGCPRVVLR
jgi:hypothetical protein